MKNFRKILKNLVFVAALVGANAGAMAAVTCTSAPSGIYRVPISTPSSIAIDPDVDDGTVLKILTFNNRPSGFPTVTCKNGSTNVSPISLRYAMVTGALQTDGITYASGIDGIGLRLMTPGGAYLPRTVASQVAPFQPGIDGTAQLLIVKIGAISGKGVLGAKRVAEVRTGPTSGDYLYTSYELAGAVEIVPQKPTCSVTNSVIPVSMMPEQHLPFTGVGSTSREVPWAIKLSCGGGLAGSSVAVFGVLTDAANPMNRSDMLPLSADSSAKGIAIQVLREGKLIHFGPDSAEAEVENQWAGGRAPNGTYSIPFTSRYVQTEHLVTSGTANARATFTLSYR
ncbi:fimbrial protein [Stenotrophomonas sp. SY1]|uniref:fimbrial protein n=1 Tax=Stenotrophomonas sp. SY1 TaxID=477235 RepID=UPI001E5DDBF3|nr:fimbrial protein [Stenotrophomonas sp. SY1]MCD9085418.1 type 1 fimbrial protein [Stenotrophomonas sp. SY1]